MLPREQVLEAARQIITADRNRDYGEPIDDMTRIAQGWSVLLEQHVRPDQVPLLMLWVKMCRLVHTPDHLDSLIDIPGWGGVLFEILYQEGLPVGSEAQPAEPTPCLPKKKGKKA